MTSRLHNHRAPQQSPERARVTLDMTIAWVIFGILEAAETALKVKRLSRILTVMPIPNTNAVTGPHR